MKFTRTKPTVPGFYWCRVASFATGRHYDTVVKVYASEKNGPVDTVFWDGENFNFLTSPSFLFWGDSPLTPPSE